MKTKSRLAQFNNYKLIETKTIKGRGNYTSNDRVDSDNSTFAPLT
ncbi:MAG: hypothetical protein AAFQ94_13090 [Bacteroidota bacterium]